MIIQSAWTMPTSTAPSIWIPAQDEAAAAADSAAANAALAAEIGAYHRAIRGQKTTGTPGPAGAAAMQLTEPTHTAFSYTGAGTHVVIQGAQGYRIAVYSGMIYQAGDAATVQILDGATDLMGPLTMFAGGTGLFLPWADVPYFVLQPGNSLALALSAGAGTYAISGFFKTRALESYTGA